MIVVDVETTGLDPQAHSLVSIGAVDFSNPSDRFYKECRIWEGAHVMPEALAINGFSDEQIRDQSKVSEEELVKSFLEWIENKSERTLAGQNPHVDLGFIYAAAHRNHLNITLAYRLIDLHSITYFHMIAQGKTPPEKNNHSGVNSDFIMQYVGIPTEPKPHIGINGAIWEAEALHRLFYKKPLLDQFKQYPIGF
jgi:DNA polymerase III epsilon subunit-like protein